LYPEGGLFLKRDPLLSKRRFVMESFTNGVGARARFLIFMVIFCVALVMRNSAVAKKVNTYKNIPYWEKDNVEFDRDDHVLDIYSPVSAKELKEVFVFIHGGSWNHGNKNLYMLLGRNMALKGKVAVIINYRLSPKVMYDKMIEDCAKAIKWVYENIGGYKGDPTRIVVSGHSAGGHLAASLLSSTVFEEKLNMPNPLKGCVLIDAFGLDMYDYLTKYERPSNREFYQTFSRDPEIWKKGSPMYSLKPNGAHYLIVAGSDTYLPILEQSREYSKRLRLLGCCVDYVEIKGKKHKAMIVQMFWKKNMLYERILSFMEEIERAGSSELTLESKATN
jgi:acetyl esterase/lipase